MTIDTISDNELQNTITDVFIKEFNVEPTQEQVELRKTYIKQFTLAMRSRGIELTDDQIFNHIRDNLSKLQKAKSDYIDDIIQQKNREPTDVEFNEFMRNAIKNEDDTIFKKIQNMDEIIANVPLSHNKLQMNKMTLYFIIISMTILLIVIIIYLIADENFHPNNISTNT